jgi:uncharacterized protein YndB with AHSA1/START domain
MSGTAKATTGRREEREGRACVVLERTFRAPVEDVWAAVTEPERLVRWVGTWDGDPADGSVQFRMTAEGEDVDAQTFVIRECTPPTRLVVDSQAPYATEGDLVDWRIELSLREADGVTTLEFVQPLPEARMAENIGPGWEYYLDRLVTVETGGDVAGVAWDEYYPSQCAPYAEMFRTD